MSNFAEGATIWSRSTLDSEIFFYKPDKWFKIWFYLINVVNHKDNKLFKRGENLVTYKDIVLATKASRNQIESFISWAKSGEHPMLSTRKTTRGMVIKLLNYELYQNLENYKTDRKTDTEPNRNRLETDTINKNEKNERIKENNIKEKSDLLIRILKECSELGIEFKSTPETFAVYENRYSEKDIVRKAQDACVWLTTKNKKELTISRLGNFLKDCKEKEQPRQHRTAQDYEREFLLRT